MKYYRFKKERDKKLRVGKIVCLARTYRKHAEEMKSETPSKPVVFLKPSSSVVFDGGSIIYPEISNCLHHEVEFGVVIKEKCRNISKGQVSKHVLGYLVALDITARDLQSKAKKDGLPWSIAKGFDTFAPISDVVLKDEISNPNEVYLSLKINDEVKQRDNTRNMVFTVEELVEYISQIMTLYPGDLIMTGTPEGVGEIKKGDLLEAKLGDFCHLKVDVK
ncbi:MAG: fumarylacetoacetate hydrolase family protein [Candidatus Thermoplasmatota archaeon]